MMIHEQITRMFNEDSDDDEFYGFEYICWFVYVLYMGSTLEGFIGPKT